VVRPLRIKTIGRPVQVGEPGETGPVIMENTTIVPTLWESRASTDRLVAALVIMVQQAHRNRPYGAATLASSSERRTA
jgi:hypothetical protein